MNYNTPALLVFQPAFPYLCYRFPRFSKPGTVWTDTFLKCRLSLAGGSHNYVMTNILIGLAVGDIALIQKEAIISRQSVEVKALASLDKKLLPQRDRELQ